VGLLGTVRVGAGVELFNAKRGSVLAGGDHMELGLLLGRSVGGLALVPGAGLAGEFASLRPITITEADRADSGFVCAATEGVGGTGVVAFGVVGAFALSLPTSIKGVAVRPFGLSVWLRSRSPRLGDSCVLVLGALGVGASALRVTTDGDFAGAVAVGRTFSAGVNRLAPLVGRSARREDAAPGSARRGSRRPPGAAVRDGVAPACGKRGWYTTSSLPWRSNRSRLPGPGRVTSASRTVALRGSCLVNAETRSGGRPRSLCRDRS